MTRCHLLIISVGQLRPFANKVDLNTKDQFVSFPTTSASAFLRTTYVSLCKPQILSFTVMLFVDVFRVRSRYLYRTGEQDIPQYTRGLLSALISRITAECYGLDPAAA